jgi:lipopolysaccharide transport system ATP-binding protein
VGIIGRNGAGKSTLLKILSRVTEPTTGYADIHGRIGSLLEVGTGFHPELTGRENIILNGAILGMRRVEIVKKFDEIVAFAEVEKFMDTPVKFYSSGMYLRLAFAVAAHLEPEILLVDEVLAVGDAAFQQKCLGRMEVVAKQGRTVLFVSHNIGAIRSLCNKGIVLDKGRIACMGDISECITAYYQSIGALQTQGDGKRSGQGPDTSQCGHILINGVPGNTVFQSEPFEASTLLAIDREITGFTAEMCVEDMQSRKMLLVRQESVNLGLKQFDPGIYRIAVQLPPLWLNAGIYTIYFRIHFWEQTDTPPYESDKFPLDVTGANGSTGSILQPKADWAFAPAALLQ